MKKVKILWFCVCIVTLVICFGKMACGEDACFPKLDNGIYEDGFAWYGQTESEKRDAILNGCRCLETKIDGIDRKLDAINADRLEFKKWISRPMDMLGEAPGFEYRDGVWVKNVGGKWLTIDEINELEDEKTLDEAKKLSDNAVKKTKKSRTFYMPFPINKFKQWQNTTGPTDPAERGMK